MHIVEEFKNVIGTKHVFAINLNAILINDHPFFSGNVKKDSHPVIHLFSKRFLQNTSENNFNNMMPASNPDIIFILS